LPFNGMVCSGNISFLHGTKPHDAELLRGSDVSKLFNAGKLKKGRNAVMETTDNRTRNPGNFANNPQRAAAAGRKGGRVSGGNFANNPERAAEAGRKGGRASGGNFANDPKRAAEAGRKGGRSSHAGRSETDENVSNTSPKRSS